MTERDWTPTDAADDELVRKSTAWIDAGGGLSVGVRVGDEIINSEAVLVYEPHGFHVFGWLPRRCRNGKTRWLCWLERHSDGTFTKSRLDQ